MSRRLARCAVVALALSAPLASATPAVAGGGGGCHASQPRSESHTNLVTLSSACFAPTVAHVAVGDSVTWVNKDDFAHNVLGAGSVFGADLPTGGAKYAQPFTEPGTFPYTCSLHPGMSGSIVVGDAELPAQRAAASSPARPVAGWIALVVALIGGALAGGFGAGRRSAAR